MFKKNIIRQDGLKDCGPTCLAIIIKYYKGYIAINELKQMCKTDRNGTTAYDLIEASKKCGFEAYGMRCQLKDINKENIILPCIAHVTINNSYNHYVVMEKIDFKRRKILINDPIGQKKYYHFDEFNKIFNNILIYMYPIKVIKNTPNNSLKKFVFKIIKSSTRQLVQVIIISIFITLFSIITSFYMQYMIDNIMFPKKIIFIFILFLILYIFKIISDFLRNKIIILINQKIDLNLTYDTFKQIINLPYCYYKNNTTGEIISKINDLEVVRQVISKVAISIFIDLPLTILAIVIMYIISPVLALVSLIIMLLYFLVIVLFRNSFNTQIDDCTISKADVTSYMIESINGYETIKGCNIKKQIMEKFEDKYANLSNRMVKLDSSYNFQYLIKELINNLGFIFIVLVGVFLVIEEQITIGQLISFNALLTYFLAPIRNIIDLDTSIKQARVAITKILNLFYNRSSNAILNKTMKGDIVIDNLNYSFGDNTVLKNINLKIINGSKVMVIGSSGSGKSTLFKILKKYYEIPRNQIYIDEIDINDYQTSDIVYVSQSEILFSDTVYNNINSNNIIDISKLCLVDKIVQKNQLGYNMLIEENGFNLSGGERQRIILARAIARDFNILVIDEGLSQVDTNMERKIMKNLFQKYQKQTIIFISHRLDNIDLFDQVIKIEKGQISDDLSKNI
mgnify:CR=1 FL=1